MESKQCSMCLKVKPLSDFGRHKNGRNGLRSRCKPCNRIEANATYRKNPDPYRLRSRKAGKKYRAAAKAWLRSVKAKRGCAACGEKAVCTLDFHHCEDKARAVTTLINKGIIALEAELRKCCVLCANCHRKTHAGLIDASKFPRCDDVSPRSPARRRFIYP